MIEDEYNAKEQGKSMQQGLLAKGVIGGAMTDAITSEDDITVRKLEQQLLFIERKKRLSAERAAARAKAEELRILVREYGEEPIA